MKPKLRPIPNYTPRQFVFTLAQHKEAGARIQTLRNLFAHMWCGADPVFGKCSWQSKLSRRAYDCTERLQGALDEFFIREGHNDIEANQTTYYKGNALAVRHIDAFCYLREANQYLVYLLHLMEKVYRKRRRDITTARRAERAVRKLREEMRAWGWFPKFENLKIF